MSMRDAIRAAVSVGIAGAVATASALGQVIVPAPPATPPADPYTPPAPPPPSAAPAQPRPAATAAAVEPPTLITRDEGGKIVELSGSVFEAALRALKLPADRAALLEKYLVERAARMDNHIVINSEVTLSAYRLLLGIDDYTDVAQLIRLRTPLGQSLPAPSYLEMAALSGAVTQAEKEAAQRAATDYFRQYNVQQLRAGQPEGAQLDVLTATKLSFRQGAVELEERMSRLLDQLAARGEAIGGLTLSAAQLAALSDTNARTRRTALIDALLALPDEARMTVLRSAAAPLPSTLIVPVAVPTAPLPRQQGAGGGQP